MNAPRMLRIPSGAEQLAVYEWPGEEPALLFAHATGFHGRIWDQVIRRLPGQRAIAFDFRGHGHSTKPQPPYNWRWFGDDVIAIVDALRLHECVAVGHSKGGHAVVYAAAHRPAAFAALLLIDPVILPSDLYERPPRTGEHFAARRRNEWESPEVMYERFASREPFSGWDRAVLWDYCRHGLLPNPEGPGYVLACPPAVEASIYAGSWGRNIYPEIARIRVPVRVLRARARGPHAVGVDMSASPTAPDLAAQFALGEDVALPHHSHFIPMEAPDLVAEECRRLLAYCTTHK